MVVDPLTGFENLLKDARLEASQALGPRAYL